MNSSCASLFVHLNPSISLSRNSSVLVCELIHVKHLFSTVLTLLAWIASYPREKQPDSRVLGAGSEG